MKTLTNIPIVETGIEYPLSTGPVTFTTDDLASIVESQDDPAIVAPRLKLGHADPRFNGVLADGEPAFGIATNLRLTNAGNTIVCDYVGVPDWLADLMPTAYPNRSIEGNWDVETNTGHKWQLICTHVALLGVVWPGISTLDDLELTLSDAGPEGVTTVAAKKEAPDMSAYLQASVNLEDVRRAFEAEIATQETGRYWWWVRAVLLDPNELIVDDDDGGLYRIPFELEGEDVKFNDPIPVKINYVDAPEEQVAAGRMLAAVYTQRPQRKEDPVTDVDLTLLRKVLGLKEDATEEQVKAALKLRGETPPAEPPAEPAPEGEPEPEEEPEEQPEEAPASVAASTVTIDKATLADLQRRAGLGEKAFESQRIAARDDFLASALAAGKLPPSRLTHWTEAWETEYRVHGNADGIKATIEQMPAGLIPVSQVGGQPFTEGGSTEAYPAQWLPELHRKPSPIQQEA
jgi:hypothetical protein